MELAWPDLQVAAVELGVEVESVRVRDPEAVDSALDSVTRTGADALVTLADNPINASRTPIVEFAATNRLPAMYHQRAYVVEGGLMSYAADPRILARRAATYVDRILNGAKPADLPVEQPTTFDFAINLRTAQALGLTIPQHVLHQATEVIQ